MRGFLGTSNFKVLSKQKSASFNSKSNLVSEVPLNPQVSKF
jgi:hypothetical protein